MKKESIQEKIAECPFDICQKKDVCQLSIRINSAFKEGLSETIIDYAALSSTLHKNTEFKKCPTYTEQVKAALSKVEQTKPKVLP